MMYEVLDSTAHQYITIKVFDFFATFY